MESVTLTERAVYGPVVVNVKEVALRQNGHQRNLDGTVRQGNRI